LSANGGKSEKKGGCLEPKKGRPPIGAMGSFDKLVRQQVEQYRPAREGWGALTIQIELRYEADLKGFQQPSRSTIAAYLKEQGKTKPYKKRVEPPTRPCYPPEFAHDLWQMDAEGNKQVDNLGTVCVLNLKDSFSKTYVSSLPLVFEKTCNHPQKTHYQRVLRLGFLEFGMNHRLQVDHESVFFDNISASPFPTDLHLWLLGLGIELCYTPKGKPHKQGMVERSHQTMHRQVIAGQTFDSYLQLFDRCQKRRSRLNRDIPCRSTQNLPPLVACPQAEKSQRAYQTEDEAKIFDPQKIKNYLRNQKWYRTVSKDKTVSLGGCVYYLPKATPKTEVEIRFNPYKSTFLFFDANAKFINSKPAQGLSFNELAGDLDDFDAFFKTIQQPSY
jgi:transposase InsO family protein